MTYVVLTFKFESRPIDSFGNPFVECRGILANQYGVMSPREDEVCTCRPGYCALDRAALAAILTVSVKSS
jgi:hypothetical protein